MDIRQNLLDTEMILKDFLSMMLSEKLGKNWLMNSGLSEERLNTLNEKRLEHEEDLNPMSSEGRLLNYCDFKDLIQILEFQWNNQLEVAFGNFDSLKAYLLTMYKFQNPDAYNRPFLSFEKHLILGVSGTIRNNISVYRSWKEVGKSGFPLIDSLKDNFSNLWTMGSPKKLKTKLKVRVGDLLEFIVTASDPLNEELEYRLFPNKWQSSNILQYQITSSDIGKDVSFAIGIRSTRKHHAYPLGYDDRVTFEYTILPLDQIEEVES